MLQVIIPLVLAAAYVASGLRRLGVPETNSRLGMLGALVVVIAHALWLGIDVFDSPSRLSITQVISFTALAFASIAADDRRRVEWCIEGALPNTGNLAWESGSRARNRFFCARPRSSAEAPGRHRR